MRGEAARPLPFLHGTPPSPSFSFFHDRDLGEGRRPQFFECVFLPSVTFFPPPLPSLHDSCLWSSIGMKPMQAIQAATVHFLSSSFPFPRSSAPSGWGFGGSKGRSVGRHTCARAGGLLLLFCKVPSSSFPFPPSGELIIMKLRLRTDDIGKHFSSTFSGWCLFSLPQTIAVV